MSQEKAVGAGLALVALVLAGLGAWAWPDEPGSAPQTAVAESATRPEPIHAEAAAPQAAPATRSERPPHLSEAQWQELQRALADHPRREAEIRRISDYLVLQSRVQAFKEARDRKAPKAELAALARPLQEALPAHLGRGELAAAEALQLQAALLQATESNPEQVRVSLTAWRERWLQPATPDPRDRAFQHEQQALLARWQARGSGDTQALERELEALRARHYD